MRLSQQEFAALIERISYENGEPVTCSVRLLRRWESGEISCPRPLHQRLLEQATGLTLQQLGFVDSHLSIVPPNSPTTTASAVPPPDPPDPPDQPGRSDGQADGQASDTPTQRPHRPTWLPVAVTALAGALVTAALTTTLTVALTEPGSVRSFQPAERAPTPSGTDGSGHQPRIFGPTRLAPGQPGLYYADLPAGAVFYWTLDGTRTAGQAQGVSVTIPPGVDSATLAAVWTAPDGSQASTQIRIVIVADTPRPS